jgi:hypothetical protein
MDHDFDALVDGARDAHSKVGEHTLWKAAMSLPCWYFVADVPGEEGEPLVGAVDGVPHLLAFTDEERAEVFSKHRASQRGGVPTPVLNMDVADAVDYCKSLMETKVDGVLFNNGKYSFQAALSKIVDMHSRYTR